MGYIVRISFFIVSLISVYTISYGEAKEKPKYVLAGNILFHVTCIMMLSSKPIETPASFTILGLIGYMYFATVVRFQLEQRWKKEAIIDAFDEKVKPVLDELEHEWLLFENGVDVKKFPLSEHIKHLASYKESKNIKLKLSDNMNTVCANKTARHSNELVLLLKETNTLCHYIKNMRARFICMNDKTEAETVLSEFHTYCEKLLNLTKKTIN